MPRQRGSDAKDAGTLTPTPFAMSGRGIIVVNPNSSESVTWSMDAALAPLKMARWPKISASHRMRDQRQSNPMKTLRFPLPWCETSSAETQQAQTLSPLPVSAIPISPWPVEKDPGPGILHGGIRLPDRADSGHACRRGVDTEMLGPAAPAVYARCGSRFEAGRRFAPRTRRWGTLQFADRPEETGRGG